MASKLYGEDVGRVLGAALDEMHAMREESERKELSGQREQVYETRDEFFVIVRSHKHSGDYSVEVVGETPVGELRQTRGRSPEVAISSMRMVYAEALMKSSGVGISREARWQIARARAAKATFRVAERMER